ncbi:hypothetical protein H5410_048549 [Solanum commersonii]|uniref:Uncharacterized protein n=1 Tax=Solanum commersonii TaxID=4109 RepID=A0A9J5XIH5_SOLCO|nr:hypothetical protein H5410_048549 [Solanum commersonii]
MNLRNLSGCDKGRGWYAITKSMRPDPKGFDWRLADRIRISNIWSIKELHVGRKSPFEDIIKL